MSGAPPRNPWSDPATETEPGAPYAGPPPTVPQSAWGPAGPQPAWGPAGQPAWGSPYGPPVPWPGYGAPWPVPPARPRRPGQVIAAAVLAFVQAGLVTLASAYVLLLASLFGLADEEAGLPGEGQALAAEATTLAAVQLVSVVALVVGGVLVLSRRSAAARWTLAGALGAQLALAAYWAVRLSALLAGTVGPDPSAALLFGAFCFAVAPAVALGLLVSRAAREWSAVPAARDAA